MIRLLIIDPVRLTRSLLAAALGREPDLHVTGCAAGIREALAQLYGSDIVLLNALPPVPDLQDMTRTLRAANPAVKVLMVGLPDSEEVIVQGIEAGIAGYVLRDASIEQMLANIRAVYHGRAIVSPAIAAMMMMHAWRLAEQSRHVHRLPQPEVG